MQDKIDPFGFKGQAQDYELSRPRYPSSFLDRVIKQPCSLKNYIDVASGPGILFYEIAPYFTETLAINDRSKKQLEVAKEKLQKTQIDPSRVEFIESDVFNIHNHLLKPVKFDLVTIAQALHFVDQTKFCEYTVNNLLAENGVLAVLGYFCDGIDYNYPENPEFAKSAQQHYEKCYSTILPYYDSDRESLDQAFANFDFKKYFGSVERIDHNDRIEIPVEAFVKYKSTSSGYNLYKNKFGNQAGFQDPVELMKTNIETDLQSYSQKYNVSPKAKPLVMKMHFFMLLLTKAKKLL